MKIKILSIWLALTVAVFAQTGMDGYRQPLTYHHNFKVDSAQALMKYVIGATPYTDTVSLLPVSGTENEDLYKASATNLNYIGGYLVEIKIYDGGSVIDTFWSTYLNLPDTSKFGSATATLPDSLWDQLDTIIADIAEISLAGDGPYLCSLYVYNGSGALTRSTVSMKQGATTYYDNVSSGGWAIFGLTLGTWYGTASAPNNSQDTLPQTFILNANKTDSISMTAFIPGIPTDTGRVIIYLWTDDVLGDTLEGATFAITPIVKGKNWRTDGGRIVLPRTETQWTDSTGYAQIEVYKSAFVHPYKYKNGAFETEADSLKYNITIYKEGYGRFDLFNYDAPDTSSVQIGGN